MANTVTQRTLFGDSGSKRVTRVVHILAIDAQETALVIYDNSAFVASVGKGSVERIKVTGKNTGICRLEWDQTTNSPIAVFGDGDSDLDFRDIGGISNPGATGATGDIVLTTIGLAAADEITVYIYVDQS